MVTQIAVTFFTSVHNKYYTVHSEGKLLYCNTIGKGSFLQKEKEKVLEKVPTISIRGLLILSIVLHFTLCIHCTLTQIDIFLTQVQVTVRPRFNIHMHTYTYRH